MVGSKTSASLTILLVALSGCASDVPGTDPVDDLVQDETPSALGRIAVQLMLDAEEANEGTALNFTLNAAGTGGEVPLDAVNATWVVEVFPAGNATDASAGNATAGDGNATTDGDGNTTAEGNGTADGNGTATPEGAPVPEPVLRLEGTGVPFTGNLTVPANGTFRVVATVSAAGFEAGSTERTLTLLAVEDVVDPCAGFAGPQEPFAASGDALLPGDVGTHEFELGPCHTGILGTISFSLGSGDMDWYLYDPSGTQVDDAASFAAGSEGNLEYGDPAGLPAGTWRVEVENFASVGTSYDLEMTFS